MQLKRQSEPKSELEGEQRVDTANNIDCPNPIFFKQRQRSNSIKTCLSVYPVNLKKLSETNIYIKK